MIRRLPALTASISALVVAILFAIGAWDRRWIADDGLIVLRTVRNLLAGNGPVFNKGERVEANTSTVWTYLIWFWSWVTDAQTEYVVLWIALTLSVSALPLAIYGTYRLLDLKARAGTALVLPFGALIYIALPPARDFATSGLEVSLCIFWAAALWTLMVLWARRAPGRDTGRILLLGFTAGISPLVRPELTLVGALALLVVVASPMRWRLRVAFVVVAAVLPVGYQIFRMGYYGLLVPNTAVAKDASGSKWEQGFRYLGNLFSPYVLLLPVIVAVVAAGLVWWTRSQQSRPRVDDEPAAGGRIARLSSRLRTPAAVVTVFVVGGLLEAVYWLRQGGDFMHARVLLVPLFLLLLPVIVIPVAIPQLRGVGRRVAVAGVAGSVASAALFVTVAVWAVVTSHSPGMHNGTDIGRSGIVDERRFYIQNMSIKHPITAEDYLDYPRMRAMVEDVQEHSAIGGVLLPAADYDTWYYDPLPVPPPAGVPKQLTVFFLNLGMTSMNTSLDVRVVDQMGLAYPIASHTERLEYARIGHDKDLDTEWVIAESGAIETHPYLPFYLDQDWVRQAKVALTCRPTQDLIASYKAPMSFTRFRRNVVQSFGFTDYRIERVPLYELERCNLPIPPEIGR
ncbi:flagellar motor control protein ZomB [uncultured Williamsia sp.]|uniref:flagellar motor control protein ZomB n=1 Tax=uncultured Williamsia sp. TaxID=259311 RepID=UPI00261250EB|nr:flagellar motor control protein ZomB [uncultured Williamsia sp.]